MLRKLFLAASVTLLTLGSFSGCYQSGRATGEAAEEVKEGAQDFERGYERGRQ